MNWLYIIAVILIIAWAIGFFGYPSAPKIIHALLVIAVIAILLAVIKNVNS